MAFWDRTLAEARTTTPALFSVGLQDGITPPSTVFAAYNHYAGEKDVKLCPDAGQRL
ncbi:acetylxylan esterase [Nonomuraea sp. NPDC049400]|uniref:acetylxylan esterase n=1 Tax=Nonomuraea sp. NPDC049400 TaxID=3364352 RepID=UPI0037A41130